MQALDSSNLQEVAKQYQRRCKIAWDLFPNRYARWALQSLSPQEATAVRNEVERWAASQSGVRLEMQSTTTANGAAVGEAGVLDQAPPDATMLIAAAATASNGADATGAADEFMQPRAPRETDNQLGSREIQPEDEDDVEV